MRDVESGGIERSESSVAIYLLMHLYPEREIDRQTDKGKRDYDYGKCKYRNKR